MFSEWQEARTAPENIPVLLLFPGDEMPRVGVRRSSEFFIFDIAMREAADFWHPLPENPVRSKS